MDVVVEDDDEFAVLDEDVGLSNDVDDVDTCCNKDQIHCCKVLARDATLSVMRIKSSNV